ncbi:unnamed protein product [Schistocephalus solidus]|uniref:Reverse transcriptase domain-containing protein n=1 Tax=Schistocephalus solidus TaxID=70667 RepID=A0A183SQZ1_SCHSO|nr:unnamed protein product [Schistocephalus solidus]
MAIPLRGIRAGCDGTPRGGSGLANHLRLLPPAAFLTLSCHRAQVVNALVAASSWYQLSHVAPRSWVLPSGHTTGNRHDRWAIPGEGLRCCVCLHTRRRMQATTRVSTATVHDLLFADDCALKTVAEEEMQRNTDLFAAGYANFGLTISTAKTNTEAEMARQDPKPSTSVSDPTMTMDKNFIDAPPPTITDTILPPPLPAPITATNPTCSTPTTSVATSDYLPPAISNTTAAPSTSDGDSVVAPDDIQPEETPASRCTAIFCGDLDWFDDNDAAINALTVEHNQLYKAYVHRPTAAKKIAFYRSRRLVQQRLREMQDAWMTRKDEEIQGTLRDPHRLPDGRPTPKPTTDALPLAGLHSHHPRSSRRRRLRTQCKGAKDPGPLASTFDNFGHRIHTEKTVAMHQPLPNTTYTATHINVNGTQLKSVDTFTYLGNNLFRSTTVDGEIAHRIAKASQAFGMTNDYSNEFSMERSPRALFDKGVKYDALITLRRTL